VNVLLKYVHDQDSCDNAILDNGHLDTYVGDKQSCDIDICDHVHLDTDVDNDHCDNDTALK